MSSSQTTKYLFVYGTLRKEIDHSMSDLLQKYIEEIDSGTFNGKLFDTGSFPAAITSDNKSDIVYGDLYKLNDPESVFQQMDPYEGYKPHNPSKSLFIRKKVSVELNGENSITSWIYLYNRSIDSLTLIPSGDYLNYLNTHQRS